MSADELNDLRTRLHTYGLANWAGRSTTTMDDMLRIAQACVEALDQFDRYEAELATLQGIAATRNVNLATLADDRDRLRKALEAIAAFNPGEFRPLSAEIAIWKQATDALHPDVSGNVSTTGE